MGSLIFPPYLQEGDRVIVLSPSSKIDKSFLKGAYKRLKSWGLEVVFAKHAGSSNGTYAGSIPNGSSDSVTSPPSIICSSRMASRRCTPPWRAISQ